MDIDLDSGNAGSGSMASVGGKLLFTHDDRVQGNELWISDGTVSGTKLVKDINPGSSGSSVGGIRQVRSDGWALFAASDGTNGVELWQTDGTPERTQQLQDIALGAASSTPAAFVVAGSRVYFAADDGSTGPELWSLDQSIFPDLGQFKRYLPLMHK
jgi:ELWxxDGT repeat protein